MREKWLRNSHFLMHLYEHECATLTADICYFLSITIHKKSFIIRAIVKKTFLLSTDMFQLLLSGSEANWPSKTPLLEFLLQQISQSKSCCQTFCSTDIWLSATSLVY